VKTKLPLFAVLVIVVFALAPRIGARDQSESPATRMFDSAARDRFEADQEAMASYRPSYPFWQHLFVVSDGSIAFGTEQSGRLLVTFPTRGDWIRDAVWQDPDLAIVLADAKLPANLDRRRDEVARRLEARVGPVVHNPTRGLFLLPNAVRYGAFLREWATIYERFGVPAEIGLAQAIVESGFSGTVRSRARAIGFCQWLQINWNRLKRLAAPQVIEGYNQTTQAPYCAAYLTILATKYGSFIPALSEHHAGGTNVGRTLINGERLGGEDVREEYFLGGEFVRDLRNLAPRTSRDLYGTYGPRSALYAEMVFGNIINVKRMMEATPQRDIFAMRTPKTLTIAEIARTTGLTTDEIRRFNPALTRSVPAKSNVYLPSYVSAFGPDVSFWHRPMSAAYAAVLQEFLSLEVPLAEWDSRAFDSVLIDFRDRFGATQTEEGSVMATMLTFVLQGQRSSRQAEILAEFRSSDRILRLFDRGKTERAVSLGAGQDAPRAE
jgi:hypothetical protein